jgi:hypothetical protein
MSRSFYSRIKCEFMSIIGFMSLVIYDRRKRDFRHQSLTSTLGKNRILINYLFEQHRDFILPPQFGSSMDDRRGSDSRPNGAVSRSLSFGGPPPIAHLRQSAPEMDSTDLGQFRLTRYGSHLIPN